MTRPALTLDVMACFPSYGGNGGVAAEHPDIREWWVETRDAMKADPRVNKVVSKTYNDTPITMIRNRMVRDARLAGAHLLLMVDSDQSPNCHRDEKWFKPFWQEAFEAIYSHYSRGPLVVGAPYCGPPNAGENCYVFHWEGLGNRGRETAMRLAQYSRSTAQLMRGVQECAALPTGLILYDMRCFDLIEPGGRRAEDALRAYREGSITEAEALRWLTPGWFHYEWTDGYATDKASTEDVQNTRDISLAGMVKLGYNPVRCAWDSWIGHWKMWNVRKPESYTTEHVAATLRAAVESGVTRDTSIIDLSDMWRDRPDPPRPVVHEPHWKTAHHMPAEHVAAVCEVVRKMAAKRGQLPLRYLEVGVWLGDTFNAVASLPLRIQATAVDTFAGSPEGDHTHELARQSSPDEVQNEMERRLIERRSPSVEYVIWRVSIAEFNGDGTKPYDVIFLDASHEYEDVKRDIAKCLTMLADDGVLLIHDYETRQFPGVTRAVNEAFDDGVRQVLLADRHGSIAMYTARS